MKCTEFVKCGQEKSCLNFGTLELGLELGIRVRVNISAYTCCSPEMASAVHFRA